MVIDLHTHSLASDGALLATELIRRAEVAGYSHIAITDHAGAGSLGRVISEVGSDCRLMADAVGLKSYVGVELTHIPPSDIARLATEARTLGAQIVVVHGESLAEPVMEGTNLAAAACSDVDILAHPGSITPEAAALAAENGVLLELTARGGHDRGNGHVAAAAAKAGAAVIVNSDAHGPLDLLTTERAHDIASGAGLDEAATHAALRGNAERLLADLQ